MWNEPAPSNLSPARAREDGPQQLSRATHSARRLQVPVALLGARVPSQNHSQLSQEVRVTLARAPLGCRVYLEAQPESGPSKRFRAIGLPVQPGSEQRDFRALLPVSESGPGFCYVPLVTLGGEEVRGEPIQGLPRGGGSQIQVDPARARGLNAASGRAPAPAPSAQPLPFPIMDLLAHVEAELPPGSAYGATPEGVRMSFYISGGSWSGPRIQARYRPEGGDWILVRRDGVALPNARATLETSDGALLYFELTGTMDLGPDGYARVLANEMPEKAALSLVARISTASQNWNWLNRLTLVGAGFANLKIGRVCYDLYSIQCSPTLLSR